jgi:hypothetical protein
MPAHNPPSITQSSTAYLNQWVKIASGDRVKLTGGISLPVSPLATTNTGYFVFRCTECQDNWHVGHENFQGNVQDPSAITVPSVLADWVKKHRHVCKKFVNTEQAFLCQSCKWPYGAHEESWIAKIKSVGATGDPDYEGQTACFDKDGNSIGVPGYSHIINYTSTGPQEIKVSNKKQGMGVSPETFMAQLQNAFHQNFPPKPEEIPTSMTLKQYTGRKFRDIAEDTCESPDTGTQKTSNE